MRPVCSAAEMRAVDAAALAEVPFDELVARAARSVVRSSVRLLGGTYGRRVVVVAGRGHNGDDGRLAARLLERRGARCDVIAVATAPRQLPDCDLVIDAAYGTGFHGDYRAPAPPPRAKVLAIDLPSGLDADIGSACEGAVRADATVTFGALKPGLLLNDGPELSGDVTVDGIGLHIGRGSTRLVEDADVVAGLPLRRRNGHKWDAPVFVVAGSPGMLGAAALTASAALRAGSGMVRLASPGVPPGTVPVTEVVARELPARDWALPLLDELGRCRALVLGPGLGTSPETAAAVRRIVAEAALPIVLDADALAVLGTVEEAARIFATRRAPLVLTPHDGEYARLIGAKPGEDRLDAARDLAARTRAVVLLKGPATVVADPSGEALIVASGTTSLSTAGTGDVLAGIIGAFLARGIGPLLAAALAAHVHGRAARRGFAEGLVASDLPPLVAHVLSDLRSRGPLGGPVGADA